MSAREEWMDAVDKLAAEKVRGWEVKDFEVRVLRGSTADVIRHEDGTLWRRTGPNEWSGRWTPTRSISDAWKLVEAMEGFSLHAPDTLFDRYQDKDSTGDYWLAMVWGPEDDEGHVRYEEANAPTAPLAITLASLRAVRAEIPEEPEQ